MFSLIQSKYRKYVMCFLLQTDTLFLSMLKYLRHIILSDFQIFVNNHYNAKIWTMGQLKL